LKPAIFFSYQLSDFRVQNASVVKRWMLSTFRKEKKKLKRLNVVFCADKYLLGINKKFLQHNFFTDIITFHYNKRNAPIEGEIFISVETVRSNAKKFGTTFKDELHRVMIHGVLHLCGYLDHTAKAKSAIRKKEDFYLLQRHF
jgi:probable rRNA maturation factor